jgi:transposase
MKADKQLHKRLTTEQVVDILDKQMNRQVTGKEAAVYLGISRRRLYQLRAEYEERGSDFTINYQRTTPTRRLDPETEKNLRTELEHEKSIIENPDIPVRRYNYSHVRDILLKDYERKVSVSTIINRAKEWGYYLGKPPKKVHDRQVLTSYTGELVQHDASHHLFVPLLGKKLVLITSLDDYSRALLYADFWDKETTWNHLQAAQILVCEYGVPHRWYVDQHRIFRYVKSRDKQSPWREFHQFTDDIDPQWKQAILESESNVTYALSPQAKGKVERPYQWIQDRVVRTCMREQIGNVPEAREVLKDLVYQYNWKWQHSTTQEIPMERYQDALRDKQSLWRPLNLRPPYTDARDIFCLRTKRIVDPYRRVSINKLKLNVPGVMPRQEVELRMYPDEKKQVVEIRFWFRNTCVGQQLVKLQELPVVKF